MNATSGHDDELVRLAERWPDHAPTAVHEAGHAVAARVCCRPVVCVTVDPNELYLGTAFMHRGASNVRSLHDSLVIALAGPAASLRHEPDADVSRFEHDEAEASRIAWSLVGKLGSRAAFQSEIDAGRERARELVATHWRHIERVAVSLMNHYEAVSTIPPKYEPVPNGES